MSWDETIPTIRPASMDAQTALTDRYQITSHLARGGMIVAAVHDPLPIPARRVELGG